MKSKELKRKEALLRSMEYNKLSTAEKIEKIKSVRGNSSRQLALLEKQL